MTIAIKFEAGLIPIFKFNENHDAKTGEFSSGDGGSGAPQADITSKLARTFGKYKETTYDITPTAQKKVDALFRADMNAGKGQADYQLEIIAKAQGFDGLPKVVNSMDELKAAGTVVYRGVGDFSVQAANGNPSYTPSFTAVQAFQDFKTGDYFGGQGYFGSGTYTTTDPSMASIFAEGREGSGNLGNGLVMAMAIPLDARMPTADVVGSITSGREAFSFQGQDNVGRALAAKGYQAYDAGLIQPDKKGIYVVLDRTMLTVLDKPTINFAKSTSMTSDDVALSRYGGKVLASFTPLQMLDYYAYLARGGTAEQFFSSVIKFNPNHDELGRFAPTDGDSAVNKFEGHIAHAYGTGEDAFSIAHTGDQSTAALGQYLGRGHIINMAIRDMQAGAQIPAAITIPTRETMAGLDNAIAMAPPMPNQTVWRVGDANAIEGLQKGKVYQDPAYTSTTVGDLTHLENGNVLLNLATISSGQKALMQIDTGSVGKGLYMPAMFNGQPIAETEKEFLMPRNTQMKYLGPSYKFPDPYNTRSILTVHRFKVVGYGQ